MTTYDPVVMRQELTLDEGYRPMIYTDTTGHITGGIGRNLSAVPFSADEITLMYGNDLPRAEALLDRNVSWWRSLDPVRQRVLLNMAFNMGDKLLGFVLMLAAVKSGNFASATAQMKNSVWFKQTGDRAVRLCYMMQHGCTN